MLTERELRRELDLAAARVSDDDERAHRAMIVAARLEQRRHRHRLALAAAVIACAAAVPLLAAGHHAASPPPAAAAIACQPGRTVVDTPRVAELANGAVITIANQTGGSVIVRVGHETAVVPPGVAEGQYALRPGRQSVQCISGGTPSTAASLSVLAARHA